MTKRKTIPKDVRNQVLVEAMHRCCLCPEHHDVIDLHHVVLVSEGGPNTTDNLMAICPTCHAKIHRIRGRYSVEQLRMYKAQWIKLCALGLPLDARMAQAFDTTRPPPATSPGIPLLPLPYFAHPYPLQANFTGRVPERQMLTAWLTGNRCPVLAVIALGGMGKSALTWAWLQRDVLGLPLPGQPEDACEAGVAEGCRINLVELEPDILLELARLRYAQTTPPSPLGEGARASRAEREGGTLACEAPSIADRCGNRLKQADCHNFLAQLALDAGNPEEARQHAETALERAVCDGPGHRYEVAFQEAQRLLEEIGA